MKAVADSQKIRQRAESPGSLKARLARHERGDGTRLLEIVHTAGITWQPARTRAGPRSRERQIKRQGGASRRCSLWRRAGALVSGTAARGTRHRQGPAIGPAGRT
jgi:hypothetical protein